MIQYHLIKPENLDFDTVLDKTTSLEMYKDILTLRLLEEYADNKYKAGSIRGFCHLVIGQENIYIALKRVLDKDDKVIGSYRCHGLAFICNMTIESIIGELLGKSNGCSKGKGGSMHLYNDQFYGGHGIVGAQVSLGTGLGFALQYKKTENVAFIFYGDGAANQGQVWESFNMAALWKLPIVYVCENNKYSMWTPENVSTSYTDYYKRGYNIPGIKIEDTDISKLIDVFSFARKHALTNGPIILQIDTYRTCSHSCLDKVDFYRTQEEKDSKLEDDCLKKIKKHLSGLVSAEDIEKIDSEVIEHFEESIKNTISCSEPKEEELYKNVLS